MSYPRHTIHRVIGLAEIRHLERVCADVVEALAPEAVPLPDAAAVWELLDAVERRAAAMKTLMAPRVEKSRAWQRAGHRSAAEFMARRAGSSVASARRQLDVARKVEQLPATAQALRTGALSRAQAALTVEGASANPAAEQRLLEQAQRGSLKELHDEVLRVRAAADPDPDATQRRIHERRRVRTWRDTEGAWRASLYGTVMAGARLEARLTKLIDEEFAKARVEGRYETREAYAFDALMTLAEGDQPATSEPRYTTIVRADLEALRRGKVGGGEVCEIAGIGPIPVSSARELLGESILKLVITKGVDVRNVTHLGRGPNAAQRVALLWSSQGCSVEGCARTRVEIDHRIPYAETRHTRLDECDPLCAHHHNRKHRGGWALVEGTGKRAMVPPGDPRHPKNRPKEDTS